MKHLILILILAAALGQPFCAPSPAAPAPTDPVAETLFDPELILHHGDDIGLTDEQREFLMAELHQAQDRFSGLNQKSQKESEALATLLQKNPFDEPAVLAQFDKLMEQERLTKRAHLTLMLTLKKKLTPEQQAKLQEIKQQRALIIARTGSPPDPHAALVEKMKRVEAGVQKWIDEGRDPAAVGELMQTFDGLTKQGKFKAAEELIDRALQLLGGEAKPKRSAAIVPYFPAHGKTAAALQAEIDCLRPAKLVWREIPWRPCLLSGLAEARAQKKPVILWAFINSSPTDERC